MTDVAHTSSATLIFDGDCAFCTTCVRALERMLLVPPRAVPYQRADLDSYAITLEEARERIWLVTDDHHYGGHRAILAMLTHQPHAGLRALGHAGVLAPWVLAAGYRLVAANRHRLPGGTPACRPR